MAPVRVLLTHMAHEQMLGVQSHLRPMMPTGLKRRLRLPLAPVHGVIDVKPAKVSVPWDHPASFPKLKDDAIDWFQVSPNDLPLVLQYGLPPAMTACTSAPFWATEPAQLATTSEPARKAIGAPSNYKEQRAAEDTDRATRKALEQHQVAHLSIRAAFQHIRGAHQQQPSIAMPSTCHDTPPPNPNVYSDGSLTHPQQPQYNLSGAGVWHPHHNLADSPPSDTEANLAVLTQQDEGLQLYALLPGHTGSSTRVELAAAIIAIAKDGPVHLGTDSQSFRAKALNVHQMVRAGTQPRRPWMLQTDGDLWKLYHDCAQAKTVDAIAITKVKGHATDQMVQQGLVRRADKVGNDEADTAADEGVKLATDQIKDLSDTLSLRQQAYADMHCQLLQHMVFMYLVRAGLLIQQQPTTTTPTLHSTPHTTITLPIYIEPTKPPQATPQYFTQVTSIQQHPMACRQHPACEDVQAFLMVMPWWDYRPRQGGSLAAGLLSGGTVTQGASGSRAEPTDDTQLLGIT